MSKLNYLAALLFIIFLAVASSWIFDSIKNSPLPIEDVVKHEPDYFLENFKATSMNEKGQLAYEVTGAYLEHFPDDNSMKIQQPKFSFYENKKKNWTAHSDEALIFQDAQEIYLTGNVVLTQFPQKNEKNIDTILKSDQLTIEAKKKIAHTKTKVKLFQGKNYIQAVGMQADMNKNTIEFMSKTRSEYIVPKN